MTEAAPPDTYEAHLARWLAEDHPARERELDVFRRKLHRAGLVETFGRRSCVAAGGSIALYWVGTLAAMRLGGHEGLALAAGLMAILTPLLSVGGVILVFAGRFCHQQIMDSLDHHPHSGWYLVALKVFADPEDPASPDGPGREVQEGVDERQDGVFHWETVCVACSLVIAVVVPLTWLEPVWPEQIWMLWSPLLWVQTGVLIAFPFGAAGWLSAWLGHQRLLRSTRSRA